LSAPEVLAFVEATAAAHYRAVRGEPMPAFRTRHLRQFLRGLLSDPKVYTRYTIANGAITDLMMAWRQSLSGRDDAVDSLSFFAPGTDVVREVAAARAHFPAKEPRPMMVSLLPEQTAFRKTLERQGFALDSCLLIGKVRDGLVASKKRLATVDRSGLTLTRMDFDKDLAAVLRLDDLCRNSDPSCRGYGLPRAGRRRDMTNFLTRACAYPPNPVLLMRHGKTLAGVVVASAPPKNEDGLLGAISIHPDFQGRGLAHWLYHEALAALDAAGVRWYRGYSSTDAVLGLAPQMKRKVAEVILRQGF
jgi:hypothetical protein